MRQAIRRALCCHRGSLIEPANLGLADPMLSERASDALSHRSARDAAGKAEKAAIMRALATTNGDLDTAMRILNLSRATLYRKLQQYGLSARDFRVPRRPRA